jgi:hypothetical protein
MTQRFAVIGAGTSLHRFIANAWSTLDTLGWVHQARRPAVGVLFSKIRGMRTSMTLWVLAHFAR